MRWPLPWPKSWRKEAPPEAEEPEEERPKTLREQVLLFARDLAVAFLIVAIVMGLLFAYARVWPPMVVVESNSMQHSDAESFVGVIDTGDLVLVQAVGTAGDVVPYIEGRATGHATYGDYGDVIVFAKPGAALTSTPIIHRAMAYVVRNATGGADVLGLARLPEAAWSALATNNSTGNFAQGILEFTLRDVGYRGLDLTFRPADELTRAEVTEGFLTKGDHNNNPDGHGAVAVNRILGKARGELPWFGLLKLTLFPGGSGCCPRGWGSTGPDGAPKNSWDALLVSLVLIIVGPFAADFGWAFYKEHRQAKARRTAGPLARLFPRRLKRWERALVGTLGALFVAGPLLLFGYLTTWYLGGFALVAVAFGVSLLLGAITGGAHPRAPTAEDEAKVTGEGQTESAGPEGGGPGPL